MLFRSELNNKIDTLKEALKGDNIEDIKAKQEELTKKFYEVSEKVYKNAAPPQDGAPDGGAADGTQDGNPEDGQFYDGEVK